MQRVFVVDKNREPLMPCHRARKLLNIVRAVVTSGKKISAYTARVAVRSSGSFNITTRKKTVQGISYRCCTPLHKSDGYSYEKGEAASFTF